MCLVVEVAVGHALPLATENMMAPAYANVVGRPMDARCLALDQHVHRALTIDELHDFLDQLCPTITDPPHSPN